MTFEKPEDWNEMVLRIDTTEAFEGVARAMFADGKITRERLLVLEVFARDVAKIHPSISTRVMRHFNKLWKDHEDRYKMLCWLHSKYEFPALVNDVVESLLSAIL